MEEEIPSSLYLLRMIPKNSLHDKLPRIKFSKFVLSAAVRLLMGYIFLFNMFLVIAQASGVLDIFYDMLSLQFIQQLDDIAFKLARIDVFGKRLKRAATQKCFWVVFEKQPLSRRRKMNIFLKAIYFFNLCALLSGMVYVSIKQERGDLLCDSLFVTFGDDIWEEALVKTSSGRIETQMFVYSYFNGLYRRNGTFNGLPIYTEQNKVNGSPFNTTIGAKIMYCKKEAAWVFIHDNIRKSKEFDEVGLHSYENQNHCCLRTYHTCISLCLIRQGVPLVTAIY